MFKWKIIVQETGARRSNTKSVLKSVVTILLDDVNVWVIFDCNKSFLSFDGILFYLKLKLTLKTGLAYFITVESICVLHFSEYWYY